MNAGKPTLLKADPEIDSGLTMTGMYNVLEKLRGEEPQGKIRWLRPEYQAPEEAVQQGELAAGDKDAVDAPTKTPKDQITKKLTWPKTLQEQIRAVRDQLETAPHGPKHLGQSLQTKAGKIRYPGPKGLDRTGYGQAG